MHFPPAWAQKKNQSGIRDSFKLNTREKEAALVLFLACLTFLTPHGNCLELSIF